MTPFLWRRLIAFMVDYSFLTTCRFSGAVFGHAIGSSVFTAFLGFVLFGFCAQVFNHYFVHSRNKASLGKLFCGLQVFQGHGQAMLPISGFQNFIRSLSYWTVWVPTRHGVWVRPFHDQIFNTAVVDRDALATRLLLLAGPDLKPKNKETESNLAA